MDELPAVKMAGIDRSHEASLVPKLGFFVLQLGSLLLCVYMIWGSGLKTVGGWLGLHGSVVDPKRGELLVLVAGDAAGEQTMTRHCPGGPAAGLFAPARRNCCHEIPTRHASHSRYRCSASLLL